MAQINNIHTFFTLQVFKLILISFTRSCSEKIMLRRTAHYDEFHETIMIGTDGCFWISEVLDWLKHWLKLHLRIYKRKQYLKKWSGCGNPGPSMLPWPLIYKFQFKAIIIYNYKYYKYNLYHHHQQQKITTNSFSLYIHTHTASYDGFFSVNQFFIFSQTHFFYPSLHRRDFINQL